MFNNNYESHLTYEKHYDMILDDEKIFTEWKYIKNGFKDFIIF